MERSRRSTIAESSWAAARRGQYAANDALARGASVSCVNSKYGGGGAQVLVLVPVSASQHFGAGSGIVNSDCPHEYGKQSK